MKEFLSTLSEFNEVVNGDSIKSATGGIQGIATIKILMDESFWPAMDSISPLTNLSDNDIRIAIRNGLGVEARLDIPDKVARILVKKQIPKMYYPCKRFCFYVFEKMKILIRLEDNNKLK